jgi:hypothetical protein
MSYKLNKTDGTLLLDLIDGVKNTSATDLTLVGKNSTSFGESFNENFIRLLENFAATSAPANPLEGQLWFDTTTDTLRVYDGLDFKSAGGAYVQSSQPIMSQGDFWYNTTTKQLLTWDSDNLQLIGPLYTATQGITGEIPDTIQDVQGFPRSVIKHYIGGTLLGLWSNLEFKISSSNTDDVIQGLELDAANNRIVKRGFNVLDSNYLIRGTVTNAQGIGGVDISKLVRTDVTSTIDANLIIRGTEGLKYSSVHNQRYDSSNFVISNLISNDDLSIRVYGSATGAAAADAIKIDSSEAYVGIYNSNPEAMLHIGTSVSPGDVIIEGNLTVKGTNTFIDAATIKVEDKNIELGILSDGTTGDNTAVDGGGITLKSSDGDKTFAWQASSTAWTSDQNINIGTGKTYKINGTTVLSGNQLGSTITSAPGLTSLGTLTSFGTNFLTISGTTITTTNGQHLDLNVAGDININNSPIKGIVDSLDASSATTKSYVDAETRKSDVAIELDITGLSNSDIVAYLNQLFPDNSANRFCRVLGINYSFTSTTDVEGAKNVTIVNVDRNAQLEFQPVVATVTFPTPATTTVTRTITRTVKTYVWDGGAASWLLQP